jgi:hypothetical protein
MSLSFVLGVECHHIANKKMCQHLKYHLVRLIRSDLELDIFGERFPVPPEMMLQYVVATIDVKEQKLKLFLDKTQVEEFDYKLR